MNQALEHYIARYVQLKPDELEHFSQHLTLKTFPKKSYLLEEYNVCRSRFFLLQGLVRTFYIDHEGNEKTVLFGKENWWITDMESYINETPARVNIQAIEEVSALVISKAELENLFKEVPKLERFFRLITERGLIAQQRSSYFYRRATSKERYETLVSTIPNFVQRIPQYMLASYLDITPEYLSVLRKMNTQNRS